MSQLNLNWKTDHWGVPKISYLNRYIQRTYP
jgi:hypothetical protein